MYSSILQIQKLVFQLQGIRQFKRIHTCKSTSLSKKQITTNNKHLDTSTRVNRVRQCPLLTLWITGFQVRSRGGEVELDPQVSPEEIISREVELVLNVGLLLL